MSACLILTWLSETWTVAEVRSTEAYYWSSYPSCTSVNRGSEQHYFLKSLKRAALINELCLPCVWLRWGYIYQRSPWHQQCNYLCGKKKKNKVRCTSGCVHTQLSFFVVVVKCWCERVTRVWFFTASHCFCVMLIYSFWNCLVSYAPWKTHVPVHLTVTRVQRRFHAKVCVCVHVCVCAWVNIFVFFTSMRRAWLRDMVGPVRRTWIEVGICGSVVLASWATSGIIGIIVEEEKHNWSTNAKSRYCTVLFRYDQYIFFLTKMKVKNDGSRNDLSAAGAMNIGIYLL